ncbi:MAG: PilW family protein [Acidiferrobacterales bacterium]
MNSHLHALGRRDAPAVSGFSLIELMVAMTLGLIVTAAVILVFAGNKHSYDTNNSFAKVQQSGRHAIETTLKDVRLAGYWGGYEGAIADIQNAVAPTSTGCNSDTWARMVEQRVYGLNDSNNDGTITGNYTNANCIPNSVYVRGDVLIIRHASPFTVDPAALATSRNYVITDIDTASLFTTNTAPAGFLQPSFIHQVVAHAYHIRTGTGQCTSGVNAGQALPSLYRVTVTGPGVATQEEIVTGVQDFQVQYGIDNNGDASIDGFVDANAVGANWANVIAVRVWLLLRAACAEPEYTDTPTYNMAGVNKNCPANVRCQLFTSTIRLRNPPL